MPVIRVSKMGKCIQKLREERGWSLEELAGRILLSPEELKCMENGIKEPDKMTVTLLGYILNVHADSLLNGEIHCRVSQTELMEFMKETIDYLEGIQKENKQIGVDMEKIQEKYGLQGRICRKENVQRGCRSKGISLQTKYRKNLYRSYYRKCAEFQYGTGGDTHGRKKQGSCHGNIQCSKVYGPFF